MAACPQCGATLPPEARFCPACGQAIEAAPATGDERKLATVLFADLAASTELGASQDPEIALAGGTVEKFAGDAVMAAFGAPAAHEDHAGARDPERPGSRVARPRR
jgi:adenylate cyclase